MSTQRVYVALFKFDVSDNPENPNKYHKLPTHLMCNVFHSEAPKVPEFCPDVEENHDI